MFLTTILALGLSAFSSPFDFEGAQDVGQEAPSVSPEQELDELRIAHWAARDAFRAKLRIEVRKPDCEREANGIPTYWENDPTGQHLVHYIDFAKQNEGKPIGATALNYAISGADFGPNFHEQSHDLALGAITGKFIHLPELESTCANLELRTDLGDESRASVRDALATILASSPLAVVQDAAAFSLATHELAGTEQDAMRGKMRIQKLAKSGDTAYAKQAGAYLFQLENLQVGMIAPDFKSTDSSGKPFSLDEMRGQIVVLTFWASWCFPCVEKMPTTAESVALFQGDPVTFIGVNCDSKASVAGLRERYGITWTTLVDGAFPGELCQEWNVVGFPTTYVLDEEGRIRYRSFGNAFYDTRSAVRSLLEEREDS